jgi:transporter family-2 protein
MIGGQLVGSLVLDILWPTAGSLVGAATIAGIVLTSLALIIASRPWSGKGRARR